MELHIILSVIGGSVAGIVYGLFFAYMQRRVFFSANAANPLHLFLLMFARLALGGILICYLLLSPIINPILVLVSFLGAFWLTILIKDLASHGRA